MKNAVMRVGYSGRRASKATLLQAMGLRERVRGLQHVTKEQILEKGLPSIVADERIRTQVTAESPEPTRTVNTNHEIASYFADRQIPIEKSSLLAEGQYEKYGVHKRDGKYFLITAQGGETYVVRMNNRGTKVLSSKKFR